MSTIYLAVSTGEYGVEGISVALFKRGVHVGANDGSSKGALHAAGFFPFALPDVEDRVGCARDVKRWATKVAKGMGGYGAPEVLVLGSHEDLPVAVLFRGVDYAELRVVDDEMSRNSALATLTKDERATVLNRVSLRAVALGLAYLGRLSANGGG